MSLRKAFAGLGALCATILFAPSADAAFQVEVFVNGVGVASGTDGDNDGVINIVAVNTIAGFNIVIETATSNAVNMLGAPIAELTSQVTVNAAAPGLLLQVLVSATDYNFPGAADTLLHSSLTNNAAVGSGTVEFQSWADPNNALVTTLAGVGGTTTGLQSLGANVIGTDVATPAAFSDPSLPFSLTNLLSITLGTTGSTFLTTGATSVSPVPEPGSIALLAMGGASLFGYGWRRRKAQAV